MSVSSVCQFNFIFFKNEEDMICYVTACTTQHTENNQTKIKLKIKNKIVQSSTGL